jgi:hypothetical protein
MTRGRSQERFTDPTTALDRKGLPNKATRKGRHGDIARRFDSAWTSASGKPRWNSGLFKVLPCSMSMSTIVAFSSKYHGLSEQTELLVGHPAINETQERKLSLIVLPSRKAHPNVACARVQLAKSAMWEWLEIGLTVVLALSVLISTLLFLATAGNT